MGQVRRRWLRSATVVAFAAARRASPLFADRLSESGLSDKGSSDFLSLPPRLSTQGFREFFKSLLKPPQPALLGMCRLLSSVSSWIGLAKSVGHGDFVGDGSGNSDGEGMAYRCDEVNECVDKEIQLISRFDRSVLFVCFNVACR
ncbi:hypothetical protein B0J15DRAFT_491278 [Fusarium solani]|uniref:Uncharacterized protein n=1 Tax=Fusarium solani TaxID=169388 RepID=A0A9P9KEP5_FUSSL|nr:uncharacterized protein B0J15DRAFT_491278 [Fusarium solani]KAH7259842.1 hypothetical protein B0J15DRAFT_491278 [Fusarium solani]